MLKFLENFCLYFSIAILIHLYYNNLTKNERGSRIMLKENQNKEEMLCGLPKDERRLLLEYRAGKAGEIIRLLKACGSLPVYWPEHPDTH